jgi:hypothetical protein
MVTFEQNESRRRSGGDGRCGSKVGIGVSKSGFVLGA